MIMKSSGTQSLFRFSENILICRVLIPEVRDMICPDRQRQKPVEISGAGPAGDFLQHEEISRVNSFAALKKQAEWTAGRIAVKNLMKHAADAGPHSVMVHYREGGAPFLPHFPLHHISITHSGDYAAALLFTGKGKAAIDMETVEDRDTEAVLKVAFSDRERENLIPRELEKIIRLFTVKEAFMKYIELGFRESLKMIEVLDGKIFYRKVPVQDLNFTSFHASGSQIITVLYPPTEHPSPEFTDTKLY